MPAMPEPSHRIGRNGGNNSGRLASRPTDAAISRVAKTVPFVPRAQDAVA